MFYILFQTILGCATPLPEKHPDPEPAPQQTEKPQRSAEQEIAELYELMNNPENFREKCQQSKSRAAKERCKTIQGRPHLFEKPHRKSKDPQILASKELLAGIRPSQPSCNPGEHETICRERREL